MKTSKSFSRLGFGAWQLGNSEFWSPMTETEGIALVQKAIELNVRFFDTAPGYASGQSETILGKAIQNHREDVFISSKFGHKADGTSDFSPISMESAVQESLMRLQTTYLDALLLHNPSMYILQGKTTHFQMMKSLQTKGLIRHYGVSIDSYDELKAVLESTDVEVIELLFNVFFQAPIPLFEEIKKRGILLVIKVPLDSGWLSGKYNQYSSFTGIRDRWDNATIQRRGTLVEELKRLCNDDVLTRYALAFILSFDAVGVVIPGTHDVNHLLSNIEAVQYSLSPDLKEKMLTIYQTKLSKNPLPW